MATVAHAGDGNCTPMVVFDEGDTEAERRASFAFGAVAAEAKSPPVLTNVTLNVADLHRQIGRWREAYEHYQAASVLPKLQLSVSLQLRLAR